MPQPWLEAWQEIAAELRQAPRLLLLSDFDGTLVPIRDHPEECYLAPAVAQSLVQLSQQERITVGIVSGRGLTDLRHRVGVPEIAYAGNHGMEIEGPGFTFREPSALRLIPILEQLIQQLAQALNEIPGAWVENKTLTGSVHYRLVEESQHSNIFQLVDVLTAPYREAGQIRVRQGKRILDLLPNVDWHKGRAVHWLATHREPELPVPKILYLGDDTTDEDVFRECRDGITVVVGERPNTHARYSARTPEEIHTLLEWLHALNLNPNPDAAPRLD